MEEQRLLLPLQLQDDPVGLPQLLLLRLQGQRQRSVVLLDPLQDAAARVTR